MTEIFYRNPMGKSRLSDTNIVVPETRARVEYFWKIQPRLLQMLYEEGGKGNLVPTGSVAAGRAIVNSDIDVIDVIVPSIDPVDEQRFYNRMQLKAARELIGPYRIQFLPVTSLEKYRRLLNDQGLRFFE